MDPQYEAFFQELSGVHPGKSKYKPMDRYRDFRQIFLGSDQGKRVLHEILGWGHMFRSPIPIAGIIDPTRLGVNEGERRMAIQIFHTINHEPPHGEKPTEGNKTK